MNVITAKWVFTWKTNEHGCVVRANARLLAGGFEEREGVGFFETFCSDSYGVAFSFVGGYCVRVGVGSVSF